MKYIQRCKQRQWDIYKDVNKGNESIYKDVKKGNEIYKDVNKGNGIYTKM